MTTTKLYRAVPFASLQESQGEVEISADSALAALEKAKATLGDETAFDLCQGTTVVFTYRPARMWTSVEGQKTLE